MARGYGPGDLLQVVVLGAIWGSAFGFIGLGLEAASPMLFAALRFDVGAAVLFAFVWLRDRSSLWPQTPRQWWTILLAGVLNIAVYNALIFWGQQFTTAGIAAVLVGLNAILTTVFSHVLLRNEGVGILGWLGLVSGLAGVGVLASLKGGSLLDARGLGELAVVGAIAAWALGSVLITRSRHGLGGYAFVAWQSLVGALLLHVAALVFEGGGHFTPDPARLASLGYLAVVSSGFGFVFYFHILGRVGPIRANVVSYLSPVFATLMGFLLIDEAFEWRALGGFVLIVAGFALVARTQAARPAVPARLQTGPTPDDRGR